MSRLKRKSLITLVWVAVMVLLTSTVALAEVVVCDSFGRCFGTNEEDTIFGTDGDDEIHGRDDDDTIYAGRAQEDGQGDDELYGEEGNDSISGGRGDDDLYGGDGNDVLRDVEFRNDEDRAYGEGGNDRINVRDGDGDDFVNCGAGNRDKVVADNGDDVRKNCEREN
jgi:Ca2+-binding RTX toxin-like protein